MYSAIKNVFKNYSTHNSHVENKPLFICVKLSSIKGANTCIATHTNLCVLENLKINFRLTSGFQPKSHSNITNL